MKSSSAALMIAAGIILSPMQVEAGTYLSDEIVATVDKYAKEYDINQFVLCALIERESSGKPNAVSPSGTCKGLMQVNDKSWNDIFEKYDITDVYDIDGNIHVGVEVFRYYLDTYGTLEDALMGYNGDKRAGTGVVSGYANSIIKKAKEYQMEQTEEELKQFIEEKKKFIEESLLTFFKAIGGSYYGKVKEIIYEQNGEYGYDWAWTIFENGGRKKFCVEGYSLEGIAKKMVGELRSEYWLVEGRDY